METWDLQAEWYAVSTRHQHERVAAHNLQSKGYEVFLPLSTEIHNWRDRKKTISLPLFPTYVFVRPGEQGFGKVLPTPGVQTWVGFGGKPAAIPNSEIIDIRRALEWKREVSSCEYFQQGEKVRIWRGPLEGVLGVFVRRKDGSGRLILSIELLQRSVAVEVDAEEVEPLESSSIAASLCARTEMPLSGFELPVHAVERTR